MACRSFIDRGGGAFLNPGIALEDERVHAKLVGVRQAQREAGIFVWDRSPQTGCDGREKVVDIQLGHQGVGYLEQHLQPVALPGQLSLIFFGLLIIQRIVDRDCDLSRDLQHEIHLRCSVDRRTKAKHQCPQGVLRGGQRQPAGSHNVILQQELHDARPAVLPADVGNY